MRWALIGASDVAARRMLPALRAAGEEVCTICSSDLARARAFALANDLFAATTDVDAALADVDAVYVSSRNELHARHVVTAAAARRHILCEKPLTTSVTDGIAMVRSCARAGVVLAVNHHLRSSPVLRAMEGEVRSGAAGQVRSARISNAILLANRLRTWRLGPGAAGGGVIMDLAVHDIDLLRFVLGVELCEVNALSASQGLAAPETEDAVVSVQRYGEHVLVTAHDAFTVPFCATSIEVHGSSATFVARDALRPDVLGELWRFDREGLRRLEVRSDEPPYVRVVRAFARAVREGAPPDATGLDGLMSSIGALALRESAALGRSVNVADRCRDARALADKRGWDDDHVDVLT